MELHSREAKALRRKARKLEVREFLTRKAEGNYVSAASMSSEKFYKSKAWLDLRYRVLVLKGNRCEACGKGPKDGATIQVDHIQARYIHPELAFDIANLQVLCRDCNQGKGTKDQTNWRKRT